MTVTVRNFQWTRLWKLILSAMLWLCILPGSWVWLTQGNRNAGADFTLPLKPAGGEVSKTIRRDAKDGANLQQGNEMGALGWYIDVFTSGVRHLLLVKIKHSVVIGLLKEDGSFDDKFVGDDNFGGQDEFLQEELYAGQVLRSSEPSRRNQTPDAVGPYRFEICPPTMKDYIPCLDAEAAITKLPNAAKQQERERHCPERGSQMGCIIAKPTNYKKPIRWPKSKDEVWVANVPRPRRVWNESWITIQKDKVRFPAAGDLYPQGIEHYLDQLAQMVPALYFGVRTRTALDVGCGAASFGVALLARGVLPLSIAPKDVDKNEVQFALDRGVPAMVAVLATRRLVYPSQAFDLIHCADCEIQWTRNGGVSLVEINRVLRAGGYFIWAPLACFTLDKRHELLWEEMGALASGLCWALVAREECVAVWQKPLDNSCYENRAPGTLPPMCDASDDPDAVWYVPLKGCISWLPTDNMNGNLSDWPTRLSLPPQRIDTSLTDDGVASPHAFLAEQRFWNEVVSGYLRGVGLKKEDIRNVMDMRAGYGGFAAALVHQEVDWWVMNVVPTNGPSRLSVIYDRGLVGVSHDWCEPFDTYPRTYDLLHAVGLFTLEEKRCNIAHIILEMDRILRPGGWVLIRESTAIALRVEALAKSVRWKTKIRRTENGPFDKDKLLSCRKRR